MVRFKKIALLFTLAGCLLLIYQCKHNQIYNPFGHPETLGKKQPNVIVILADDLGKYDVSLYGGLNVPTPHIDSIGINGVTFDNGYATAAICAPSRAGLITGQYQQRFGFEFQPHRNYPNSVFERIFAHWLIDRTKYDVQDNEDAPRNKYSRRQGLTTQVPTMAEVFKKEGYRTGIFGKWHLGAADSCKPNNRGFDEQYGFYEAFALYAERHTRGNIVNYKHLDDFKDKWMWRKGDKMESRIRLNDSIIHEKEYLTFAIARHATKFIADNHDRPFFMYVPFNAPHEPFQAPRSYYDKLAHIKDNNKRIYYAMIAALDDAVGMIMAELKKQGLEENTIVVFTSDNGAATYTKAVTNYPLKGGKFMNFEGGIQIPYMVQWKGNIPPGKTLDLLASHLDIFSTVCKAAEINTTDLQLDGINLLPFMKGVRIDNPPRILYWRSAYNYAARALNWKVLADDERQTVELYNLAKDPGERDDVQKEHPVILQQLQRDMKQWDKDMREPAWPWILNYKVEINGKVYYFAV
jgi:arylsulfatase A-like enzyme